MSNLRLLEPFLEKGIRNTNFFNGRLLSGEDLSQEQAANREARRRLGQAIGEGIAFGLEVSEPREIRTRTSPAVTVTKGLALNRQGYTLSLPDDVEVSLVRPLNGDATTSSATVFAECQPPQSGIYLAGAGVYLLTIAPAAGGEGRAPVSGLGNTTAACNTRYTVEGVQFRLIQLDMSAAELSDGNRLRNRVAYKCFGADVLPAFSRNPFGPAPERYGLLDMLRPTRLTNCEVPLAIICWTADDGLKFIDLWSVRRRLIDPSAAARWGLVLDGRRLGEAEAMFLQFQDQVARIQDEPGVSARLRADERFAFLPAAGFLPTGANSFDWRIFLGPHAPQTETLVDEGILRAIVHRSFFLDPIPVNPFADAARLSLAPPVPVSVYKVPTQSDFILFTRATEGRIRVFLTPATATVERVYAAARSSNAEFTAGRQSSGEMFMIEGVSPGSFGVTVTARAFEPVQPVSVTVTGGQTTDVAVSLQPLVTPSAEPPRCVETELFARLVEICMHPDDITFPRKSDPNVRPLEKFSEEVATWLAAWQQWLMAEYPERGVDPTVPPSLFVDSDLPRKLWFDNITKRLKSYARFGGVIVPISIEVVS